MGYRGLGAMHSGVMLWRVFKAGTAVSRASTRETATILEKKLGTVKVLFERHLSGRGV